VSTIYIEGLTFIFYDLGETVCRRRSGRFWLVNLRFGGRAEAAPSRVAAPGPGMRSWHAVPAWTLAPWLAT
jgi:hypothetical protein